MYEVEKVVAHRLNKKTNQCEYLIKWQGYPSHQNTWEPIHHLDNCQNLIAEFHQSSHSNHSPKRVKQPSFVQKSDDENSEKSDSLYERFSESEIEQAKIELLNRLRESPKRKPKEQVQQRKKIDIVGIGYRKNDDILDEKYFKIVMEGESKWVQKKFILPEYALEYIQYLESKIVFHPQ